MWVGTAGGLNRFDGNQVKVYAPVLNDSTSLADPYILGPMFEDAAGNLWFATANAVHCYQRSTDNFRRFPLASDNPTPEPVQLDAQGILWVCGAGTVYQLDTRTALNPDARTSPHFVPIGQATGSRFSYMEAGPQKGLLLAYGDREGEGLAIHRWEAGRLAPPTKYFNGPSACKVQHVWQETPGVIWCATAKGLCRLLTSDAGQPAFFDVFQGQPVGRARSIQPLSPTMIAVATNSGLYFFDTEKRHFTQRFYHQQEQPGSLAGDNLHTLLLDQERNLWVSVWTKGIDYVNLDKNKFQFFQHKNQKSQKGTFVPGPMLQTADGTIWCGSQMHGLIALNADGSMQADYSAQIASPEQLFDLGNGELLVSLFGGPLVRFLPAARTTHPILYQQKPLVAGTVVSAGNHVFYVAPMGEAGLLRLQVNAGKVSCAPLHHPALSAQAYYWGCRGRNPHEFFWVDYTNKLYQLRLNPAPVLTHLATLSSFPTASLSDAKDCWISGAFGLLRLSGEPIASRWITPKEGLPDNMVYALLKDRRQYLWLSTNKGLVRCQPDSLQYTLYALSDGLQDLEFNRNSALAAADGQFWFGGINGINRFDPLAIRPLPTAARPQITGISIQDAPRDAQDNVGEQTYFEFPWNKATLSFYFAALEFSDPANTRLKYRLEYAHGRPYDKDWVVCPDAKGFARYANLPPDQYRLKLMAANSDGRWNEAGVKQIGIEITPPFWKRTWFLALMGLLVLTALYVFYRFRLAQLQRANLQKLEMAEAEMKALRAQLSPHFIYNSLNSIKAFLLRNDLAGANDYLSGFARLMRAILESSIHHTIRLEDELDLLRAYVKTETKHLAHPVHYEETVSEAVDPYEVQVPGMLLQPFVENALVHGLKPLQREGRLAVQVAQQGQHLLLSVEDDGLGRGANQPNKPGKPPSRALQITGDRLKYYDLRHGTRSEWRIVDLIDAQGAPRGTRVEIRLGLFKTT